MGKRIELHMDNCEQVFDEARYNTQVYGWVQEIPCDTGIDMSRSVRDWVQSGNSEKKMLRLRKILVANR